MIEFSRLGNMGRCGNILFQVATCLSLAKKYGVECVFPVWPYSDYFDLDIKIGRLNAPKVDEPGFEYHPEFWDSLNWKNDMDIVGYLQNYKQFPDFKLEFKEGFKNSVLEKFGKPDIGMHVRRGDYVGNPNYVNLPPSYYFNALEKLDWRNRKVTVFTDDIPYCQLHYGCFENVEVSKSNEMEALCLMSMCDALVVANSSFSFWGAYLSNARIIRPSEHFAGNLLKRCDIREYYPETWEIQDVNEKIDLRDTTFTIPVFHDHKDRLENLTLVYDYLLKHFDTNIIIGQNKGDSLRRADCEFMRFDYEDFWRTKMLNQLAIAAKTPFIANWDADVLATPGQILESVQRLRNGADVVYPYGGRFARVQRNWLPKLRGLDLGILVNAKFPMLRPFDRDSKGGAVFFNRESFFLGGGENEKFIAFGPEDAERYERFTKLGFNVQRVDGNLYHVDHFCGIQSGTKHKHITSNRDEWHSVAAMSADALREYVQTWESFRTFAQIIEQK